MEKYKFYLFNTMYSYVIVLILSSRCVLGNYHEQYRVPLASAERWESYIFNDREYVIENVPVRWQEAQIICRGRHNGSLAILDNIEKADFMAEAMAESQFPIDSAWVGARRSSADDPEGYRWVAGSMVELRRTAGDVVQYIGDSGGIEPHYPSWLNRTHVPEPETGADCVAVSRMYHDKPVFLDLPCDVDRPFVCEKEAHYEVPVVQLKTVRCSDGVYHVYDGRLNWDQAAAYCVLRRMTLAHINSMRCLKKLGITLLRSRPSIESAWIGARGDLGKWTWMDDGQNIFTHNVLMEDGIEWPPIRDRHAVKQSGCLLMDRHTSHLPVFLEARCERKLQFICYEGKEAGLHLRSMSEPPSDELFYYVLVRQQLQWSHAYDNCLKMKGTLATIENADVITQLLLLMGENKDLPIGHIWVAGRLNSTKDATSDAISHIWYNPITDKKIPDKHSVQPGTDVYIPPWLEEDLPIEINACLNLDRENHLSGMIYGLPCDKSQYSICMIEKSVHQQQHKLATTTKMPSFDKITTIGYETTNTL